MAALIKNKDILIFPRANDLFQFAANDFANRARKAVEEKGVFYLVLSGGNTPKLFLDSLSRLEDIPWDKIEFFFGDERYVPADDSNSNYHMAYEHLFSKVPISPSSIYRIPTEYQDPQDAAKDYEQKLRQVFRNSDKVFTKFDLVYLGLGENAHTASIMPYSDVAKNYNKKNEPLVAAVFLPESSSWRITLTPQVINNSQDIIFLITGKDKAIAVQKVLEGPFEPLLYPAQMIHSIHHNTFWYIDSQAGDKLNADIYERGTNEKSNFSRL